MTSYRPLNELEWAQISEGLRRASRLIPAGQGLGLVGVQALYDALLTEDPRPQFAVKALGFAFGQSFLEEDWLQWAMSLDDEFGDQISIAVKGRQLGCSPLSMIANRLEDGEAWNLANLRADTIKRLRELEDKAAAT